MKLDDVVFYNNTSFPLQITEALKAIKHLKDEDPARYHQRLVIEYMRYYPHARGLLIYHKMGAGKTILGAAITQALMEDGVRKTIFISAKSLHDNFRGDLRKYLELAGKSSEYIDESTKSYKFVSLNASNMIQQVYKATQKEGLELFSSVFEKIFKPSKKSSDSVMNIKKFKEQMDKINALESLDGTNVVIDEAHNFFNSVTNGSKNALALYYMMLYANDVKIMFLTGSPIINDPFELAVCFNVLAGLQDGNLLFGENYNDFTRYFVDNGEFTQNETQDVYEIAGSSRNRNPRIKNKSKFMNRISGLVSYFGADSEEFKKLLPRPEPIQVLRIPMSQQQYSTYIIARDKEMDETKRSVGFKSAAMAMQKPGGSSSSYRVMSRQISNFLFPPYASKIYRNERGHIIYEKDLDKLTKETFDISELQKYSPKLVALLGNLQKHLPKAAISGLNIPGTSNTALGKGPGLIYSQYVESGVNIIGKALERYGMKKINSTGDLLKPQDKGTYRFAIISGEIDDEFEDAIKKAYNMPENKDGEIIAVLLVTVKGAEGINLFTCRHEHMFEPFWHYARVEQFFDRGVRPGSLNMLPEKDRTVYRYIYLADYPVTTEKTGKVKTAETDKKPRKDLQSIESTTDITLYGRAVQNNILRRDFTRAMQEASIDCGAHYDKSNDIKCRICLPNDKPLYVNELQQDMKLPSQCDSMSKEKVKTKSITVQFDDDDSNRKVEYMYNITDGELHIFEFDKRLNGYIEIFSNHPDYYEIYKAIKSREKKIM